MAYPLKVPEVYARFMATTMLRAKLRLPFVLVRVDNTFMIARGLESTDLDWSYDVQVVVKDPGHFISFTIITIKELMRAIMQLTGGLFSEQLGAWIRGER